jgi:hypothetical protein
MNMLVADVESHRHAAAVVASPIRYRLLFGSLFGSQPTFLWRLSFSDT